MNAVPQCLATNSHSSSNDRHVYKTCNINWVMDIFPPAFPLHVSKSDVTTEQIREAGNGSVQLIENSDGKMSITQLMLQVL